MARLETVRTFYDLPAAEVARATLIGHGIPSHLFDAHLAGMAWHYIFALGGIRLVVVDEYLGLAQRVLEATEASRADADAIDPCPACGTDDAFRPASLALGVLGYLVATIPLPVAFGRRSCRACGATWRHAT
ncbi:MAG: hypothetical protein QNJ06_01270 [Kiloniellales bacterium]|nr:hypothetical protein [Kiloniellales bacterium]